MRTTVRIDDDVLRALKKRAQQEKTSLTTLMNLLLRKGLLPADAPKAHKKPYREKTYSLGVPTVDLTKALAIAAALENEEILRKMALGK